MSQQHYGSNVVSVSTWCRKCRANTQHRVDGHRVTRVCIPCQEKEEAEHQARMKQPAVCVQTELFGESA